MSSCKFVLITSYNYYQNTCGKDQDQLQIPEMAPATISHESGKSSGLTFLKSQIKFLEK